MTHPFKLAKLFGTQLSRHDTGESVYTNQLQANTVIGLYFASADESSSRTKEHTERLVLFHKQMQEISSELSPPSSATAPPLVQSSTSDAVTVPASTSALDFTFQVIMISFDETEKSIIAIPKKSQTATSFLIFDEDEKSKLLQEYLIRKYRVQESPTLILIDGNSGRVINFDGVGKICEATSSSSSAKLMKFPWRHSTFSEILFSGHLITLAASSSGASSPSSTSMTDPACVLKKEGLRGLLFSAYWCPPCRAFVGQLKEVYQKLKDKFGFEVIFISSDRSQESFDRFMATMPWHGIPFSDEQRRLDLTSALNIKQIPTLIIIDGKDNIITTEGRADLNDDLDAMDFPWPTKLVEELRDRHSSVLNHTLCLIYFIGDDDSEYDKAEAILHPIATQITESNVEEAFELKFFIATDSDLAESLRLFIELEDSTSYVLILDIPNFRYAIASPTQVHDEKSTIDFLQKFQNSQLKYRYIQSRFI